jgi:hypothetical protein
LDRQQGLSTAAKIAIGVVIPVIALGCIGVLAWLFYRRKARQSKKSLPQESNELAMDEKEVVVEIQGPDILRESEQNVAVELEVTEQQNAT